MPAFRICVPSRSPCCLLPLWETLQHQQVGLTQTPFKFMPLRWDSACGVLHVPFSTGVCIPQPSGSLVCKPHWPSKPDILVTHLLNAGPQHWGADLGLRHLAPWRESLKLLLSSFFASLQVFSSRVALWIVVILIVPMEEGELRVFLLHHLGCSSSL